MNEHPERNDIDRELLDLFDAYCHGTATPEQLARLEQQLVADSHVMDTFVLYTDLHARLQRQARRLSYSASLSQTEKPLSLDEIEDSTLEDTAPLPSHERQTSRTPILGFLGDAFQAGTDFLSRSLVLSLLVAIGLPGLLLLLLVVNISRQPIASAPVANRPAVFAEITRQRDCVWDGVTGAMPMGTRLGSGQKLQLRKGLAELTFTGGATVILEGPCSFRANSRTSGSLEAGSLVAKVPKPAVGFAIDTPTARVVDLGTEFGVAVDGAGKFETHVFVGEIEVGTKPEQGRPAQVLAKLRAGEAAQFEVSATSLLPKVKRIKVVADRFVRRISPDTHDSLPELRIDFAHQGDRDPKEEGWKINLLKKEGTAEQWTVKPQPDDTSPAWSMTVRAGLSGLNYRIEREQGLSDALLKEAREKGWVLRARVKVVRGDPLNKGLAFCSFWEGGRRWRIRPTLTQSGQQGLLLLDKSSLGKDVLIEIPHSRDRYVDYEVRYHPSTQDADVFANGRYVATIYGQKDVDEDRIQFGKRENGEVRWAKVQWGVVED